MTADISFAFTPRVYTLLAFGHHFPETGFNDLWYLLSPCVRVRYGLRPAPVSGYGQ